jgi:hypothetical protein
MLTIFQFYTQVIDAPDALLIAMPVLNHESISPESKEA